MARFYVAGPLFSAQDRWMLERIEKVLSEAGHQTFLPHRDGEDDGASRGPEDEGADARRRRIFAADMEGLARADAVVALLDGPDCDAGTAFEMGWAYAERRPIFGLRTDFRTLGPEGAVSLMLLMGCDRFVHADDLDWDEVAAALVDWAATVRPYGGRLVRDAVPKLLEEKGHPMTFRAATAEERPLLLKNKVEESARALRKADRAEEKEALADLLEATEALIKDRGYDAASLRMVKEGRWKTRGGFDRGWVVDG